jgi:FkbM family methyltransferase
MKLNFNIILIIIIIIFYIFSKNNESFDNHLTHSQLNQDLNVLDFYNNKTNGFFIEIGANDGITLSNTYLLEKKYNWKGICVEPIPEKFELLVKNRPNSSCSNNAVYNQSNLDILFDVSSSDLLSGIHEHVNQARLLDGVTTQIIVKTISFTDLLNKFNAPKFIEYLSIDTEGSELEILKSLDYDKYIIGLIDVEHNYIEPARSNIRNFLVSKGYEFFKENKFDDTYKHNSM